jgi:hypothetical protein
MPRPSFAGVFGSVRMTGWQHGFELRQGHGGSDADDDRVRREGTADFPCQVRDARRLDAQDHDAGAGGRLFVVFGLFFAGDGRDPVMALCEPGRALSPAHRRDDVGRIDAAVDQPAHDCLVH